MLPPNWLEVHTNYSYATFIVSGYSSRPTKAAFLIASNSCPYLYSSACSKNNITPNLSSSVVTSYGVSVSTNLSIVLKLHRMFSPPASIKFCSPELNPSNYSSLISSGPWRIVMNEIICSIRDSLGFAFTSTPAMIFFSSSIIYKQQQSFYLFS